jgi:MFS transporter, FSR family, fosmidomycin resistance protein
LADGQRDSQTTFLTASSWRTTDYTFYLISRFGVSVESAQFYLFAFLAAVAVGTLIGGPLGDRIGRKSVLWGSIVGVLPFTLALPYVNLFWTGILTVVIGLTLASASSAIIVYALELVPGKIGTVAGLFFGLSFGMAGIGAAALGGLADATSIDFVYQVCAFLPLIGLLTVLLPDLGRPVPPMRSASAITSPDKGSITMRGGGASRKPRPSALSPVRTSKR